MSVKSWCVVGVDYKDGTHKAVTWNGGSSAVKLKAAIKAHYAQDPKVKSVSVGNVVYVNSYGAH